MKVPGKERSRFAETVSVESHWKQSVNGGSRPVKGEASFQSSGVGHLRVKETWKKYVEPVRTKSKNYAGSETVSFEVEVARSWHGTCRLFRASATPS